jgi:hypothetical protein
LFRSFISVVRVSLLAVRILAMHTIRLGPPWEITPSLGTTHHARKFGRPRTLDANERLWLVCTHVPGSAEITMNGEVVGTILAACEFSIEITSFLQQRNTVAFLVASDEPLGAVTLEIRTLG